MSRAKKRGRGAARWHKRSAIHIRRKRQEEERKQKKAPNWSSGPFLILSRRRPTFPHSYPCSIIGPARLNFRVRDGNGCDPRGMTTGNLRKRFALGDQISGSKSEAALRKLSEKIGAAPLGRRGQQSWLANTSSARCRTITVCYKTLQIGLETSLQ